VKRLPGKVYVHREFIKVALLLVNFCGSVMYVMELRGVQS
jgi:hypothetical protein